MPSFDDDLFNRLFLSGVEWMVLVTYCVEVNLLQVDTPNGVVVCRLEIDLAMGQVNDGSPMCGTGYVGRFP